LILTQSERHGSSLNFLHADIQFSHQHFDGKNDIAMSTSKILRFMTEYFEKLYSKELEKSGQNS
jgi:hypothetical protein